ncbi:hypothetical protein BJ912DRAFT_848356 [Pholiota molesta]|nr:hypothetical protein BJ912DRAFT_848356 [Pholiota molesta]
MIQSSYRCSSSCVGINNKLLYSPGPPLNHLPMNSILNLLDEHGITTTHFLLNLLKPDWARHHAAQNLINHVGEIMNTLLEHSHTTRQTCLDWADVTTMNILQEEMCLLTHKESGFHFTARKTTDSKLMDFDIQQMSVKMKTLAPRLWNTPIRRLITSVIGLAEKQRVWERHAKEWPLILRMVTLTSNMEEDEYWAAFDDEEINLHEDDDDEPVEVILEDIHEQFSRLKSIKQVVCLSIMMQSTNRLCNTLQSAMGIFLHSCGSPEAVSQLLAHMGISISTTSINEAINNLAKEANAQVCKVGQGLSVCYAYDNLDIDLKHSVPTVEKSQETLIHLTTGTLFPLNHINFEDLNCSDELWKLSPFNRTTRSSNVPKPSLDDLFFIHPEPSELPASGLNRRERFNAWKFLSDLVHHGPDYFWRFRKTLGDPEVVDPIPVTKTHQIPLRCLDVSPSTPGQNAEALDAFFLQTGVGDPADNPRVVAVGNTTIPIAGDLLTLQHDRSLQESRGEEDTSWRRLQGLFFIMGLVHLKMACADAIWRVFISEMHGRKDPNSLMEYVAQIRPKETGRIETKPGFRRMHEVIQHIGIASRLDLWRLEVEKKSAQNHNLEKFAESKPTWEELSAMANIMAQKYVANDDLGTLCERPTQERDKEYENALVQQQYFLLYEEMSHAMNFGDIGRVEICFLPWMMIFAGCGKHKYTMEMCRYLENVHFVYPRQLRQVFAYFH